MTSDPITQSKIDTGTGDKREHWTNKRKQTEDQHDPILDPLLQRDFTSTTGSDYHARPINCLKKNLSANLFFARQAGHRTIDLK